MREYGTGCLQDGYICLRLKRTGEHPYLGGRAFAHQIALFEKIGIGPHQCHWCGTHINWNQGRGKGMIYTDHLNWDRSDNRPENLVPSCITCNFNRIDPAKLEKEAA